ncbi:hypothetical protein TNCV_4979291 [Trichonephila clavipes]|nr:hypothetical protein TNCV_4979281 [Trichonephila clavipes]GFS64035.1 hypothetical protein TNCV_4979291 [Trichonephila clavipes]
MLLKLEREPHQGLHRRIKAFSYAGSTVTHTQSPNPRISVPIAYLQHVNGAQTRDQNRYDPRYGSTKDSGTVPSAPWYSVRQGTNSCVAICTKSSG